MNSLNNLQPLIAIRIPEDHYKFLFFVHNKDQMYFPRRDEAFGSFFFSKRFPSPSAYEKRTYVQNYRLDRTRWKTLSTKYNRCDEGTSIVTTTTCITQYLEHTIGCSMGLHGNEQNLKRFKFKSAPFPQLIQLQLQMQ